MKKLNFIITAVMVVVLGAVSFAQTPNNTANVKTETIKVMGSCGMCKSRIEKAAKLDGVSAAVWNKETNSLTVSYDSLTVSSDDIQKKVAAVGHDTEKYKADDNVYTNLPGCCKYR
jgi:copper chaperone CopZ